MDDDGPFTFADDNVEASSKESKSWSILVVDDEGDVHDATRIALRGLLIEGRKLRLFHAFSAEEAYQILADEADIAVVLLDVVMETEDAGLQLVRRIRNDLGNSSVRIVLRTGQPGYAPEIDTIRTYDINDYKTKSELTRIRLFTTLAVALRSYHQIHQLEMSRRGLELIIAASTGLGKLRALRLYAEGVVTQLCSLLGLAPEGLVCAASRIDGEPARVIAAAGRYRDLIQCPLDDLPDDDARAILHACLDKRQHVLGGGICLYFGVSDMSGIAAFVDTREEIDPVNRNLIDVFCANATVGFENVLLQERLYDYAYTDQLLNVPNRKGLIDIVDRQTGDGEMVLALIDLDDFAEMNTVLDHHFGDQVLSVVARRLASIFGPPAVLARVGGDTFGLLGSAELVTPNRIEAVFAAPFDLNGEMLRVSATSSLIKVDHQVSANVLKDASIALKQAKILKRGRATLFSEDLSARARERIHMLTDLRAAFSAERLFLAYQPQVDLPSGKVLGAEALLRWKTEDGRSIPPDQFIPLAEQSGLTVPIGEWVLRTACHQLKRLTEGGHANFRMAINVSHTQFREPSFVPALGWALQDCRVDPSQLELELTESVAIGHIESTSAKIQEIRNMGITVAMDDFGTGYSSLSVLKQLNVDRLKVDRSFVMEIGEDGDATGIAELVIALGRQLRLVTIAEGVESEEQRRQLLKMGCHEGQGYLFGRPMPAKEFEAWMAAQG
ncbi:GGDEF/EAL domain-containing response regulator [Roseospirillum parvum]|uniref:Diguanylate cyclase (GGDEF) domain-containing protein n=1 Tax=Roseospirillum parvum TaxID=83401 RepID=A0A1G7XTM5_9PROT|nr:EAL domain-containing protein [Roseospirillum parvum]SDG87100.1 diguanylate cyclase (GGDEF) domain-containing protein [Roseospirillum parvum]